MDLWFINKLREGRGKKVRGSGSGVISYIRVNYPCDNFCRKKKLKPSAYSKEESELLSDVNILENFLWNYSLKIKAL